MKKKIVLLLSLTVFGISSLYACPHTMDGSDCSKCKPTDSLVVVDRGARDLGNAAKEYLKDYAECVAGHTVAGAVVGNAPGAVGATVWGLVDCGDRDTYLGDGIDALSDAAKDAYDYLTTD